MEVAYDLVKDALKVDPNHDRARLVEDVVRQHLIALGRWKQKQ